MFLVWSKFSKRIMLECLVFVYRFRMRKTSAAVPYPLETRGRHPDGDFMTSDLPPATSQSIVSISPSRKLEFERKKGWFFKKLGRGVRK